MSRDMSRRSSNRLREGYFPRSHCARLRDSLSNPSSPLLALVKGLEEVRTGVNHQVEALEVDSAIATSARENRMLSLGGGSGTGGGVSTRSDRTITG